MEYTIVRIDRIEEKSMGCKVDIEDHVGVKQVLYGNTSLHGGD